ncbi:arylamine N-acetyltransferase [Reichenbachiella sp. MSK19-1]|uniref:arylamine N-acetyltransferase family protein n=1 Tax=Reichenbachiella sp. MSK19-1 TaxID=1897631 RepID=UPI000E6B8359|nr:arylamine N-acetyltransferase [Reichenbachiella sp. MSK19-1]RJE71369.1 hypothetical protein BGP76_04530 [Reichenbachiella sp. MSK19-1]
MSTGYLKRQKPKLSEQEISQYLARIRTPRELKPSLRYLRLLHRNHLMNIPFENLDISMRREIILDIKHLNEKILIKRRGGFCYELNGFFYCLLQSLGFEVHLIGAQVYDRQGNLGSVLDHAALLVYLDDNIYLCDVGFGDSFSSPKVIHPGELQMDYTRYFRIDKNADEDYTLSKSEDSLQFDPQYVFSKKAYQLVEFIDMCHYHQTNPKSHFTKQNIISQAKPDGRIILTDKKLITQRLGEKQEQDILNHDEFCSLLQQHFGITYEMNF